MFLSWRKPIYFVFHEIKHLTRLKQNWCALMLIPQPVLNLPKQSISRCYKVILPQLSKIEML